MTVRQYLTPYDTGQRAEPRVWANTPRMHMLKMGPIGRELEEDRYGKVDFDDDAAETLFTVWVERNEQGHYVVHVRQQGQTPVAIRIHSEADDG